MIPVLQKYLEWLKSSPAEYLAKVKNLIVHQVVKDILTKLDTFAYPSLTLGLPVSYAYSAIPPGEK